MSWIDKDERFRQQETGRRGERIRVLKWVCAFTNCSFTKMQEEAPHEDHKISPSIAGTSEGVQIIKCNKDNSLEFNEEALRERLLHPEVIHRYVCVISIAGAFRMGKSFLLNFLLFYLEVKYRRKVTEQNWLQPKYGKVTGFHFQHGSKPDTEGILMWPEIFLATLEDGTQVAIVLMDTQGAFDGRKSSEEFSTLFALSSIISSVQIYNLMRQIRADDLNYLEYFAGRTTFLGQEFSKFQKLLFLVRDWSYEFEHSFGTSGGEEYLRELFTNEENSEQTRKTVENLENMFDNSNSISCFLLPEPGDVVATAGRFQGDIKDLGPKFVKYVQDLTESLLAPEKLILKEYHGEKMTAEGLFKHVKKFTAIFQSGDLPQIKVGLFALMQEEYVSRIMEKCETLYENAFTLGRFAPLSEIEEMPLEIAQKFFEQACRNSLADEEFFNYADKLGKSLSLLSYKMKDQHLQTEKQDTEFFENLIKKHIIYYEKSIESEYNDEVEFLTEDEFTNTNETARLSVTKQFLKKRVEYLVKIEEEILKSARASAQELLGKTEFPEWVEYIEKLVDEKSNQKYRLKTTWLDRLKVSSEKLQKLNNEKHALAIEESTARFHEQVETLKQEYYRKIAIFAQRTSFFDNKDVFLNRFRAEHEKIRAGLLNKLNNIKVTRGLEFIKEVYTQELLAAIQIEYDKNVTGLHKIFRLYKIIKIIGINVFFTLIGAIIVALAPASGFLAIIARIIAFMPK